jgi:hypothetical protein
MSQTLYAVQIFLPIEGTEPLRQALAGLMRGSRKALGYQEKWEIWSRAYQSIASYGDRFAYGVWDYVEDPDRAEEEYEQWCSGTLRDSEEARLAPTPPPYRDGDPRYMFVTCLALLEKGSPADAMVCEACRVPEPFMWTRATLVNLLRNFTMLNQLYVREDALFVRPIDERFAVRKSELETDDYDYLHELA